MLTETILRDGQTSALARHAGRRPAVGADRLVSVLLAGLLLGALGCSGGEPAEAERADAQSALDDGVAALARQDYAGAEAQFTAALGAPGLNADQMVDVQLSRAVARAHLGHYEQAHEDLNQAELGAADLARVHAARSYVYALEGKTPLAEQEWVTAQELNPAVEAVGQ
ncbi:MAG: hypothetical protein KDA63_09690 [Planctomycetales bacterium]|nr:hypothetical protein [Planctomycetales bacterium]